MVRYEVNIRRCSTFPDAGATLAVGDASVLVDGTPVYALKGARVGLFRNLADVDHRAAASRGREGLR